MREPDYTISNAFNYGWGKFQQYLGPILIGTLVLVVGGAIVSLIWQALAGAVFGFNQPTAEEVMFDGASFNFGSFLVGTAVSSLGGFVISVFVQAGITRGALAITYGRQVDVGTLLDTDQLPQVLLGALIIGLMGMVGFILCIIPGLVVYFFTQFFVHFCIDKKMDALDAIKASFGFVNKNLGTLVGFFIASLVAYFVGALLCGIGLLVAFPVVIIAQAYTYRRLQDEPVAA